MQFAKKEIRNKILEEAKLEFINKGFNDASIRSIVKNSNISLGNLYRYYKNKEELYNAIVNPVIIECLKNVDTLTFKVSNFENISKHMVDFYNNNKEIFKILQKGNYVKYNDFLIKFGELISYKIKKQLKIKKNDKFIINVLSISFVNGTKTIMENYKSRNKAEKEIFILLNAIFKDIRKIIK